MTGQEKRLIVQNFAHFQQFSRPGAKGNTFARIPEVPRCETACVFCQRKDWIEHRHKLNLFGQPPTGASQLGAAQEAAASSGSGADVDNADEDPEQAQDYGIAGSLLKHGDVHYLQSPELVHALLDVDRYVARWPLIPVAELHASSVQHPSHPDWRWLLHVRRVPVKPFAEKPDCDASQLADTLTSDAPPGHDTRPRCAGIGDENNLVWTCWDCLQDLGAKKPKMPVYACANDNWDGRKNVCTFGTRLGPRKCFAH